jgi:hypothetical protein
MIHVKRRARSVHLGRSRSPPERRPARLSITLAVVGATAYLVPMARIALTVLGIILAVWLVFGFVIPALFATLKILLVLAIIAFVVVAAITVVGKLNR